MFTAFFSRTEARLWWRAQLRFALLAVALCVIAWWAAQLVPLTGIAGLAAKGVVAFVVSAVAVLAFFRGDAIAIVKSRKGK